MLKKTDAGGGIGTDAPGPSRSSDDPALTEPEITITHDGESTYYEYTVNGQLREIKVVPKVGKPYYLVPADGSKFIRVEESQLLIPKWVIFRW